MVRWCGLMVLILCFAAAAQARCTSCARDEYGHIRRSSKAKHLFMTMTGHPHGWRGHVIDHIVPLDCGGADAPSNMQWQTIAEAKAKDAWERIGCEK